MKTTLVVFVLLFTTISLRAQKIEVSGGKVVFYENFQSLYVDSRSVYVWLPADYDLLKKYAVLYMHDGQMLFDSTITWNKQEWMVDETLGELLREKKIKDVIVVGVANNGQKRHAEYFPEKALKYLKKAEADSFISKFLYGKPQSDAYLSFLVKELKPFIDGNFPTFSDQENTFVAGSSMGGLISIYALCEYPDVFYGAACLSTHWTGKYTADNNPIPAAISEYLTKNLPEPQSHKIYFDFGSETLDSLYKPYQIEVDKILISKGFSAKNWLTKEFPGDDHSERAWAGRLAVPLTFLLRKQD
ncbi:MAG: alpha/beta hydrolase [Calditrichaeota bacterium]|nr:alpha/beta hydrolase [Calditrichota bacterium]